MTGLPPEESARLTQNMARINSDIETMMEGWRTYSQAACCHEHAVAHWVQFVIDGVTRPDDPLPIEECAMLMAVFAMRLALT